MRATHLPTRAARRAAGPSLALACLVALVALPACASDPGDGAEPDWARLRARMVAEVAAQARHVPEALPGGTFDPAVLRALGEVPRHLLVPAGQRRYAYQDRPLPIGRGQTISQPFIVALMTDLLDVAPGDTVLEVGTGSGYQAAVLAQLGARVHTVEIVPELAARAAARLADLGYDAVTVHGGDGYAGLPDLAPFPAIVVTAAAPRIPPPLLEQLAPGGRLVMPVGEAGGVQELVLVTKGADGRLRERRLLPVRFVPLTGKH